MPAAAGAGPGAAPAGPPCATGAGRHRYAVTRDDRSPDDLPPPPRALPWRQPRWARRCSAGAPCSPRSRPTTSTSPRTASTRRFGDLDLRGVLVVADAKDGPGSVVGQLVNNGTEAVDVTIGTAGGPAPSPSRSSPAPPWRSARTPPSRWPASPRLRATSCRSRSPRPGPAQNVVTVPVLPALGYYEDSKPSAAPSGSAPAASPSASPSEPASSPSASPSASSRRPAPAAEARHRLLPMIEILTPAELARARETGALVADILQTLRSRASSGTNLLDIDRWARSMIVEAGRRLLLRRLRAVVRPRSVRAPHLHVGQRRRAPRPAPRPHARRRRPALPRPRGLARRRRRRLGDQLRRG